VSPKYVLLYDTAEDVLARAPAHTEAHAARTRDFHERGALLMGGVFADALADGAMCVFHTREGADEFARGDPFVLGGAVRRWGSSSGTSRRSRRRAGDRGFSRPAVTASVVSRSEAP
jgi:uncharacterized protein